MDYELFRQLRNREILVIWRIRALASKYIFRPIMFAANHTTTNLEYRSMLQDHIGRIQRWKNHPEEFFTLELSRPEFQLEDSFFETLEDLDCLTSALMNLRKGRPLSIPSTSTTSKSTPSSSVSITSVEDLSYLEGSELSLPENFSVISSGFYRAEKDRPPVTPKKDDLISKLASINLDSSTSQTTPLIEQRSIIYIRLLLDGILKTFSSHEKDLLVEDAPLISTKSTTRMLESEWGFTKLQLERKHDEKALLLTSKILVRSVTLERLKSLMNEFEALDLLAWAKSLLSSCPTQKQIAAYALNTFIADHEKNQRKQLKGELRTLIAAFLNAPKRDLNQHLRQYLKAKHDISFSQNAPFLLMAKSLVKESATPLTEQLTNIITRLESNVKQITM